MAFEDLGRELEWEDTIQKDSSFTELPAGDYDFVIDHYKRSRFQGGSKIPACNMAMVYFNISAPNGETVTIKENFILYSKLEWKLSELFCSVGLKKKGEKLQMNWNALPGLAGRAQITLDPDKNDPSKKFNHIKKLYPKEQKRYTAGNF